MKVKPNIYAVRKRFGSHIIDAFFLALFLKLPLSNIFWESVSSSSLFPEFANSFVSISLSNHDWNWHWQLLLWFIYSFVQEALFGATLGKTIMGLRVVKTDGQHITWFDALCRNFLRSIDYLFGLGVISVLLSPRRQRLGDRIAGTLVVDVASVPFTPRSTAQLLHSHFAVLISIILFVGFCIGFSYYGRPPFLIERWNRNFAPFERQIDSYTLGLPKWNNRQVTYPMQFHLVGRNNNCSATLTLGWMGLLKGGWCSVHGIALCDGKTHSFDSPGYGCNQGYFILKSCLSVSSPNEHSR